MTDFYEISILYEHINVAHMPHINPLSLQHQAQQCELLLQQHSTLGATVTSSCDMKITIRNKMSEIVPHLTFEDIQYVMQIRGGSKTILNKISGTFPSGKLIGILGPSGAGKSTLLNILSGWDHNSEVTGSMQLNNEQIERCSIKNISGYITQECNLINILSVADNLKYAADLKLGRLVSQTHKKEIIDKVVQSFGLVDHLETPTGKLSGGQRKRLAICLELLSDPDIIFLDEPTTGLDSVSALQCMAYLNDLTERGKSVICTLHQPSARIMKMIDIIYIIANGQCAYQGCTDKLVTFLADNEVPCGLFHSPIDYVIEISSGEYGSEILEKIIQMTQNGKNMRYMPIQTSRENNDKLVPRKDKLKQLDSFRDGYYELKTMIQREFAVIIRDMYTTYFRMACIIGSCIFTGLVCYDLGSNVSKLHFNYNMTLILIACLSAFYAILTSITFSLNQNIIRNEYENGYYSIRNYYLASTIMELPLTISTAVIGSISLYILSGQFVTPQRLFMFSFISVETAMTASSLGYIIGSLLNLSDSFYCTILLHLPLHAISGFGITAAAMPRHFYYLSHVAYTRYALRSLMGIIFGYDKPANVCPEEALYCQYQYSSNFLREVGLEDYYFVYDSLILAGFYLFFRILAYFIIRYRLVNGVYNIRVF